jgi:cytochrome c oxidase cbb3-type subunit 3
MKSLVMLTALLFAFLADVPATAQNEGSPYIGKHLYRSFCAICHGRDGMTKGPLAETMEISPPNLTLSKYQKKSVDELTKIIAGYGRKEGSQMPSWTNALPESSLRHIAAYIGTLTQSDLRLIADLRRGRLIYKNACAACHGARGKGNGILAMMIQAKMADFSKPEVAGRLTNKGVIEVIRKGRGKFMPSWTGTLNDAEILDVAAYVRSLQKKK